MKIEDIRTNSEGIKRLINYLASEKNVFLTDPKNNCSKKQVFTLETCASERLMSNEPYGVYVFSIDSTLAGFELRDKLYSLFDLLKEIEAY